MNTNGHTKACVNTAVVTFGAAITTNASSSYSRVGVVCHSEVGTHAVIFIKMYALMVGA